MPSVRVIPSIDELLQRPALARAAETHGRALVTASARRAADLLRELIRANAANTPASDAQAIAWLESSVLDDVARELAPSLVPVINATGVLLHTNLGRAPLAADALRRLAEVGAGYSNLEYDLTAGARGHRHAHAERLLTSLTGAEAALVVNNNAGAALLVLASLAAGREVIVSRGELVEIGGGFRVPEVLAQSGATLREVGTTNRTRVGDYAAAISDRTALLLRVHPSNFRIEGFTERPALADLVALGRRFELPVVEDLGSGWLGAADAPPALAGEPSVRDSVEAGADVVLFSGDKLLGGPQAGIGVGRRASIDRARAHPLMRALRADKLTHAALEATLSLWAQAPRRNALPVWRMLTMPVDAIERRARAVKAGLDALAGVRCRIADGVSTTGGGAAPESRLPTRVLILRPEGRSADQVAERLRRGRPPVIVRIEHDDLILDLRTVAEAEDGPLGDALVTALEP
jgi:L-seryl-tRNA(Ser) seleniumtransferase